MLLYKYGFLLNKMKYFNNKKYQEINIFPKNWSFSERSISIAKQPLSLVALGFFVVYRPQIKLK